jgi:hypothetical protein
MPALKEVGAKAPQLKASPRVNPKIGAVADFLKYLKSPKSSQQMQGLMSVLPFVDDLETTLDRVSYGEPLTTGQGMTTALRPEAKGMVELATIFAPGGRFAKDAAVSALKSTKGFPVGMSIKDIGTPQQAATTAGMTARAGSKTADVLLKKSDLIQAKRITPPHEVRDTEKLDSLVASMKKNGWQGRPILAFDVGNGLEALTGTHRLAAAKQAGIEDVPVLKISDDIGNYADEYGRSIKDISDEEDVLEYLKNFGDKDAFELMRMEQGQ